MLVPDETLITVQREWNGWRTAFVRLRDLQNIHWVQPRGAPRRLVHAYISCTNIVEGDIPHECQCTPPPHPLLVCILKSHSTAGAYAEIARRADQQQLSHARQSQVNELRSSAEISSPNGQRIRREAAAALECFVLAKMAEPGAAVVNRKPAGPRFWRQQL